MLALLDSSLAVTVYSFPDGTHQGAENRAIGLTARQIELQGPIPAVTHKTEVSKTLSNELQNRAAEVRTNCIAWSSAPVFQSLMGFAPEASLLALGNRAGGIQLWRYVLVARLSQSKAQPMVELVLWIRRPLNYGKRSLGMSGSRIWCGPNGKRPMRTPVGSGVNSTRAMRTI
jgi:hypothetical protein